MKKILLPVFLLFSALAAPALSADPGEDAYKKGDYKTAAEFYASKFQSGPYDYAAAYNYANCLYRLGDNAGALAYYMKAFNINPRNSHIFYNLNYLSIQTGAGLFPQDVPAFVYRIYFLLSMAEIKALAYAAFWFFCVFYALFLLGKKTGFSKTAALSSLALCILFSMLYILRTNSAFYNSAIINSRQARIMSGPGDDFKLIASAENAKPVKILSESGEWAEIGLLGKGVKGWIKAADLIRI